MGRSRQTEILDSSSGLPLPRGVVYRGPSQYRARKLVNGRRATQTFTTARKAARWLTEVEIDAARGQFVDLIEAQRHTLCQIIKRYRDEILGEDSEKRGAEAEKGHLKIVLQDEVCSTRMSMLTSADIAAFRDRMKAVDYAPAHDCAPSESYSNHYRTCSAGVADQYHHESRSAGKTARGCRS